MDPRKRGYVALMEEQGELAQGTEPTLGESFKYVIGMVSSWFGLPWADALMAPFNARVAEYEGRSRNAC